MKVEFWQIIILTLYAWFAVWDSLNPQIGFNKPVIAGCFAGLVLGDVTTGLAVGGTLQLMILGVGTYGGATIPDYMSGALIGTAFAVISNQGLEFALGLAVPIGLLLVQFDILARFSNIVLLHKAEAYVEKRQYRKMEIMNLLGIVTWGLSRAIPVFFALYFGNDIVQNILSISPEWLLGGLKVAGSVLPALGVAILLRYLPVQNFIGYLLIGFVVAAYLSVPMLGVAIVGAGLAIINYKRSSKVVQESVNYVPVSSEGGIIDEDE